MKRSANVAVLALSLSCVGACVSDLSVGLSALDRDDSGVAEPEGASDGGRAVPVRGDASTRDAQAQHDGSGRDASARDASARDESGLDAHMQSDGCAAGRCASEDASERDAELRDAELRDAERTDAERTDAARPCALSDCQIVGLRTLEACADGSPRQCLRDDRGMCDLLCPPSDFVGTGPADGRDR
jgi:hypothetical protein